MVTTRRREVDRRTWLVGVGAGTVAGAIGLACVGDHGSRGSASSEAWAVLGGLTPGDTFERWTLVAVHPIRHGALPVVVADAGGRRFQVDVLARDWRGGPQGVANTAKLSLFVANRGNGGTPTDEDQGLGAMALARTLQQRGSTDAAPPDLTTFARRAAGHPDGSFAVPVG